MRRKVSPSNKAILAKNQMPQAPRMELQTFCWNRRRNFNIKADVKFLPHPRNVRDCREEKEPVTLDALTTLPLSPGISSEWSWNFAIKAPPHAPAGSSESLSKLLRSNWKGLWRFLKGSCDGRIAEHAGKGLHDYSTYSSVSQNRKWGPGRDGAGPVRQHISSLRTESTEALHLPSFSSAFSSDAVLPLPLDSLCNEGAWLWCSESESEGCSVVSDSLWPHGLYSPWTSPGQNTGVGSLSLLQGIFPTQGWNPGLPLCRQILYQLSHQGSSTVMQRLRFRKRQVSFQKLIFLTRSKER